MRGERFVIRGDKPLAGEVAVCGSKNAATKMMVASLLTDKPCTLDNIPLSQDVAITMELCGRVGGQVVSGTDHSCTIETREILNTSLTELSRRNRIPILAVGPLLHRRGEAEVPFLGGDPIGHRPIDFHLEALANMGATVERRAASYYVTCDRLHGAEIILAFPSVGATETVLLAASLAEGETVILNAAVEPEALALAEMLKAMGAVISYDVQARRIDISGVARLNGVRARVIPDRNEAVSFAAAALATGGEILIRGAEAPHLEAFLRQAREIGGSVQWEADGGLRAKGAAYYRPTAIETAPHPGFMTDWQQPFSILLTKARGTSIIHETVYEDRLGYLKDLMRMGADIAVSDECTAAPPCRFAGRTFNHSARISGPARLRGGEMEMLDIRAGMAHVIAALAAEGESVISGVEHIDRGYERIDERLRGLGAEIRRIAA